MPTPSKIRDEERELVVVSGASVDVLSKKRLNSAELETVRVSPRRTTVLPANGSTETDEEAIVGVNDLVV